MAITVRPIRRGVVVRLTGAHAQALAGLLLNLMDGAAQPADAPNRVPERSETDAGAGAAAATSNGSQPA
ncbi:MAG: hypothetical protein QM788_05365 [Roseateles sp.]|uniref:hypothetical protein n=1 Tax=Roseateles sp. TaxID=1971397 RepID=UPI0039EC0D46